MKNLKKLQAELDYRQAAEKIVERLIIEGKFEEAFSVLDTIDNDRARRLLNE